VTVSRVPNHASRRRCWAGSVSWYSSTTKLEYWVRTLDATTRLVSNRWAQWASRSSKSNNAAADFAASYLAYAAPSNAGDCPRERRAAIAAAGYAPGVSRRALAQVTSESRSITSVDSTWVRVTFSTCASAARSIAYRPPRTPETSWGPGPGRPVADQK